VRESIVFM